jgi:hypothetical protein
MKRIAAALAIVIAIAIAGSALASGIKQCEELKAEIDAKLQAKGVKNYTLEIVPAGEVKDQTVVGSCEGGTRKITYLRK